MEIELNSTNKKNKKFYYVSKLSKIFQLKKIDFVKSFCVDVQHTESEGELQRSIILFFLNIENFYSTKFFKQMKNYLKKQKIDMKNIKYFFKNIHKLDCRLFNVGNVDYEDITLTSGEALIIFEIIPFFFYEKFEKFFDEYYVRNFVLHFRINNIIMKKEISNEDIILLEFLVKERLKILVDKKIKIMPKSALEIHFGEYIRWLGPIRYFSTFKFENHHSQLKKEVDLRSKNLAITYTIFFFFFIKVKFKSAFNLNYMFYSYDAYKIKINEISLKNNNLMEFESFFFNNHLIDKNCCIEVEEEKNKKIGKIESIFKFNGVIIFKVKILKILEDKIGIFYLVDLTNSPDLTKFVLFKEVKVFFKMLVKNNLIFLVKLIYK
jgi:hypothetical protein